MTKQTRPANPNPEFLIKSIAEQGYSLETAISDLIDNSITANADQIEILTKDNEDPFLLFLADNGDGMSKESLFQNLQFPSKSMDDIRNSGDLGRFGLGLKTASFSQTRCFTVISRQKGSNEYAAFTWDVNFLKEVGDWRIIENSPDEILELINLYKHESLNNHLNSFPNFSPNTIIIWQGFYKFDYYQSLENKREALKDELTNNTAEYLSIVFHKFLEKNIQPLKIRVNNTLLDPYNPFPIGLRALEPFQNLFENRPIKFQGFVLPNEALKEAKEIGNKWTTRNRSLMDMEGVYVYRADRLIIFGGWNGMIKKAPRLQLARLKVEIGNNADTYFHLNVSKSKITTPYGLKLAFLKSVAHLKKEAQKEYYNFETSKIPSPTTIDNSSLFFKTPTNKGIFLEINHDFPSIKFLKETLSKPQLAEFNFVIKLMINQINKVRMQEINQLVGESEQDGISLEEIKAVIINLLKAGMTKNQIKSRILPDLGITSDNILEELKDLI